MGKGRGRDDGGGGGVGLRLSGTGETHDTVENRWEEVGGGGE